MQIDIMDLAHIKRYIGIRRLGLHPSVYPQLQPRNLVTVTSAIIGYPGQRRESCFRQDFDLKPEDIRPLETSKSTQSICTRRLGFPSIYPQLEPENPVTVTLAQLQCNDVGHASGVDGLACTQKF